MWDDQEDFNWLKWFIVLVIILAALSPLVWAAPAPQPRTPPPLVPGPGAWVLEWAGTKTTWDLTTDGKCKCRWGGDLYQGTWYWDASTRTLHVNETKDGKTWGSWHVVLEPVRNSSTGREIELTGRALWGTQRTFVTIYKARFAVP
jgi:hypothetical protein